MAGIALLLSYLIPVPPTLLFFAINLPFFVAGWRAMGARFGAKSLLASVAIMAMGLILPLLIEVARVDPIFAALFGGSAIGLGTLAIARHGAGVGGLGMVALMLQRSRGWSAGRTQMIGDIIILLASAPILGFGRFGLSVLSAIAINAVLIVNHRPGRYMAH
jgi:uncharacterized membrane-anchored protein YitT (DUF2179 family)